MKYLYRSGFAAALAAFALSAPASAQGPGQGQGQVMQQCRAEIAKHCANVPHGAGGVPACLDQHKDDLSDTCRNALANRGPGGGPGMGMGRGEGGGPGQGQGMGRMRGQ